MSSYGPMFEPSTRNAFPKHIGIINDYVRIPYANGSSFASQFLYREFVRRGHGVTVLGPRDPETGPADLPRSAVLFESLPLRNHPGVFLALPSPRALADAERLGLDVVLAQTGSGLLDLGIWLRARARVPLLCVNTIHLPSVYNVLLPDRLHARASVLELFDEAVIPKVERLTASAYNLSDGVVVLSEGLARYWRERGVTVPIHVIPRPVDPRIFDRPSERDPFPAAAPRGGRLLCVCRHSREKNVARLIRIFAEHLAPKLPNATLTLVGDGPDHDSFRALAEELRVADRVFFVGEFPVTEVADFYRAADVFVYASLSETYGQVVSEALYCGLPVVAFRDDMGVSHQLDRVLPGLVVDPGPDTVERDLEFGSLVRDLLENVPRRRALGHHAAEVARERSRPELAIARHYDAFEAAREHCLRNPPPTGASKRLLPIARWTALHVVLAAFGHLRPPAILNRHGRTQPTWEALVNTPAAAPPERRVRAPREIPLRPEPVVPPASLLS